VPVRVVEDDAAGGEGFVGVAHGFELGLDGGEGLRFGGATIVVEAVELFGEGGGAIRSGWVERLRSGTPILMPDSQQVLLTIGRRELLR